MPTLLIYDTENQLAYEANIHANTLRKLDRFLENVYNGGVYSIFLDGSKQGELDEDEYEDFKRTLNIHPRRVEVEKESSESLDVVEYDADGNIRY